MQRQLHLFGDAADPAERSAPTAGIGEATNLATWIESTNTSDDALAYLAQAAVSLAERHPVLAPADALRWVLGLHERVQGLLQGKQRLRQRRELFGIQSGLLAHVCLLLGDLQQADTAGRYGDLAELAATEGGLSPAPAFSARAQVARWQNRYADAAVLAAAGSDSCNSPSLRALLACQEANAAALAGDRQRARAALERAAAGLCPATESAWSLPGPRFVACRVSVALHLGDPASALREAEAAERPRSSATWAHLRVSLALAHLMLGSPEGAAWAAEPVFGVPSQYRVATVVSHLAAADQLLRSRRFRGSAVAAEMREQIRVYTASSVAGRRRGAMNPYPARMENHWSLRPGRRPGRELYQWDLLFHDHPQVRSAAAQVQRRLAGLPELDLVAPQWLHVTTYIAGFADEIPGTGVRAMVDEASRLLSYVRPITVTLGRIYLAPQAVVLPLEPFAALEPVLSVARMATMVGGADGHQDADPWTPHISVAYSRGVGPAAPVIAALGERLPDLPVTIRSLSLVAQVQAGRSWQWRQVAEIEFGEKDA